MDDAVGVRERDGLADALEDARGGSQVGGRRGVPAIERRPRTSFIA